MNRTTCSPGRSTLRAPLIAIGLCIGLWPAPARAQQSMTMEQLKKKMEEISQLMRESERLLLKMTQIERLAEQQRRLVEELEKLKPPTQPTEGATQPEANEEEKKRREELQKKQQEVRRRLENLFENQRKAGDKTVAQLVWLLKNLPSGGRGGSMPPRPRQQGESPSDKPKQDEKKQNPDDQDGPRKNRDDKNKKSLSDQQKKAEREQNAQLNRIEAWVARLPRAEQERINRNDFSGFPSRYRRLLREYTRLRAEREVRAGSRR